MKRRRDRLGLEKGVKVSNTDKENGVEKEKGLELEKWVRVRTPREGLGLEKRVRVIQQTRHRMLELDNREDTEG